MIENFDFSQQSNGLQEEGKGKSHFKALSTLSVVYMKQLHSQAFCLVRDCLQYAVHTEST